MAARETAVYWSVHSGAGRAGTPETRWPHSPASKSQQMKRNPSLEVKLSTICCPLCLFTYLLSHLARHPLAGHTGLQKGREGKGLTHFLLFCPLLKFLEFICILRSGLASNLSWTLHCLLSCIICFPECVRKWSQDPWPVVGQPIIFPVAFRLKAPKFRCHTLFLDFSTMYFISFDQILEKTKAVFFEQSNSLQGAVRRKRLVSFSRATTKNPTPLRE